MTPAQLENLQHALGLDPYGRGTMYRNSFVTDKGCDDHRVCMELVALGFMTVAPGGPIFGGMDVFKVTDAGKFAAVVQSPPAPRPTRSQRRYLRFLSAHDAFGMTLREFLSSPYAKARS